MPRFSRYQSTPASDYHELREVLAPQIRRLPAEDIEALFESVNLSAEDFENYLESWGDIGKAVSNYAPSVLGGAVQGASAGASAGPYGMLAGAILGGLSGGLSKGLGQGQVQPSPQMPSGGMPAGQTPPVPTGGMFVGQTPQMPLQQVPIAGGAPAAGMLLQILSRPEVIQALISMLLGQLGRSNVPVGSTPVPVGAYTNLLGALANQAQAEYNAARTNAREGVPEYLRDFAGEAVGDPAVAEHRARALWELLQETDVEQTSPRASHGARRAYPREAMVDEESFYDQLELAEFYAEDDV